MLPRCSWRATATEYSQGFASKKTVNACAWTAEPRSRRSKLDVTDPASIAAAAEFVGTEVSTRGLGGLVNNAGIGLAAPIEYVANAALRQSFEVNLFGAIAVTQAFLPLVRRARGRIINIGSIGDQMTIPFGGVLCATKSALRSITDALRMELRPFGIHVSLIEPGSIRTPAVDKTLGDVESILRELPPEGARHYAANLREFAKRAYEREAKGSPPDVVANAILGALTAERPRARYAVGKDAAALMTLSRLLPDRALDALRARMLGLR